MRAHVFQHVSYEDIGSIHEWLSARGAEIRYTRFYANDRIPTLDGVDLLIVMGGPMSVNDETEFPWLVAEKLALREAIARGIPVLGICLGSQLVASALGARVYRNPVKEIGWFPIHQVASATPSFAFPSEMTVFHWHGETFDLPPGATHLAQSAGCKHQAFQIGQHVVGLQFHLEMTADALRGMVEHNRSDLTLGPYVQTEYELFSVPEALFASGHALMGEVLTFLVSRLLDKSSGIPLHGIWDPIRR